MTRARLDKELLVKTENKVGMLAEVSSAIAGIGINIKAICAYGNGKDAYFMVVTTDNGKAEAALKSSGYEVSQRDVILLDMANKPGAAKDMADKLKGVDIDLNYIYGTTHGEGEALLVLSSNNNAKAVKAIN